MPRTGTVLLSLAISLVGLAAGGQEPPAPRPPDTLHAAAQLAVGTGFDDAAFGFNTRGGQMSLLGLTMSAERGRASHSLLLFLLAGSFLDEAGHPSGESTRFTAEWTSQYTLTRAHGALPGLFLAGQLARDGAEFRADLAGFGVHASTPIGIDFWVTAYGRAVEGVRRDMKGRFEWEAPFHVAGVPLHFNGYEDVVGSRPRATEWSGVWQLLARSGRLVDRSPELLEIGLKWFHHSQPTHATSAPLLMVRWAL